MSKYGCTFNLEVLEWTLDGDTLWPKVARYPFVRTYGVWGTTE